MKRYWWPCWIDGGRWINKNQWRGGGAAAYDSTVAFGFPRIVFGGGGRVGRFFFLWLERQGGNSKAVVIDICYELYDLTLGGGC